MYRFSQLLLAFLMVPFLAQAMVIRTTAVSPEANVERGLSAIAMSEPVMERKSLDQIGSLFRRIPEALPSISYDDAVDLVKDSLSSRGLIKRAKGKSGGGSGGGDGESIAGRVSSGATTPIVVALSLAVAGLLL